MFKAATVTVEARDHHHQVFLRLLLLPYCAETNQFLAHKLEANFSAASSLDQSLAVTVCSSQVLFCEHIRISLCLQDIAQEGVAFHTGYDSIAHQGAERSILS